MALDTSTLKQVIIGFAAATAISGGTYVATRSSPTYIVEGNFVVEGPCDGGTCHGQIAMVVSSAIQTDAGILIDAGSDAGPTDSGATDSGPDASIDASIADASAVDSGPVDGSIIIGIYSPPSTSSSPDGPQLTVANLTEPNAGSSITDPQFPGVVATRLLTTGFVEYSQLRAFSDDSTLILVNDGTVASVHRVYRFPSMVEVPIALSMANSWTAPRWRPKSHQIIYYLGSPARIAAYDVDTGVQTILATTPYQYASGSPVWENGSDDGNWAAIYTYPDNLPAHNGSTRILSAMNLSTGQPGAVLNIHTLYTTVCAPTSYGEDDYDWATPSPSGRYLVVGWVRDATTRCSGLEVFDIKTGAFIRQLYTGHNHGSLAIQPDGTEVYVTSIIRGNWPEFVVYPLDGSAPRYPRLFAWDTAGSAFDHIGCNAPGTPYCVVSGGGEMSGGPLLPGIGEVWLINYIDGSSIRLFHARAGGSGGGIDTYFHQEHANLSRDGRWITWTSDWNGSNVAPFVIHLF